MMRTKTLSFLALIFLTIYQLDAQSPQLINYQGKLLDKVGKVLSGTFALTFSIYPDTAGTVALWTEKLSTVLVNNGIFNVLLGGSKFFPNQLFQATGARYLGIKVENEPEMRPLFRITSVPYAISAMNADTAKVVLPEGIINALYARPIREQMVHRRILFGYAGDTPVSYQTDWVSFRYYNYGPFGYATPAVQPGATRKFRLYAVYCDNMTTAGENQIRFEMDDGNIILFAVGRSWGDPNLSRDGFSEWKNAPWPTPYSTHALIKVRATATGGWGRLYYLELQAWDFFE